MSAAANLRGIAELYVSYALADDTDTARVFWWRAADLVASMSPADAHATLMEMLTEVPLDGPDRTETPETLRRLELTASLMELLPKVDMGVERAKVAA